MLSLAVIGFAWPRRSVPGAKAFIALMCTSALWSGANALEMMGLDLPTKLFWANVQYIAYNSLVISWLIMALQFTGRGWWLTRRRYILLLIIPVLTVIVAWTNQWHGLLRQDVHLDISGPFPVIGKTFGPWIWVHSAFIYPVAAVGFLIYIRALIQVWRYRWQVLILILGAVLPYSVNLAHTLRLMPLKYDIAPVLFSICGIFYAWGMFRFELFDRLQASQSMVIQSMGDGMLVFDRVGRLARFNPAALRIIGATATNDTIGKTVAEIFGPKFCELFQRTSSGKQEILLQQGDKKTEYYETRWWPVLDGRHKINGHLLLLHNITEVKVAQDEILKQQQLAATLEERERLARELHDSLGQVMGYMNIQIQAIRDQLGEGKIVEADSRLFNLSQVINESNAEIREFIYGIKSSLLFKDGFFKTLEQYAANFTANFDINVMVNNPAGLDDGELALPVQAQLFRIIQEACVNVRKHARAKQITIDFQKNGSNVQVVVNDNGIGFDHAKLPEGKRFGQGIMQERAASVGGDLQIQSTPGKGTQIMINLPSSSNNDILIFQSVAVMSEAPEQRATGQTKLILVDDHALFLDGLNNLLVSKGFQVVATAKDGWEALEKTRVFQPDLVLMDLQMPDYDGLMATRLIKAEFSEIKIVILTMSDREKDLFEAIKSGATGYLLKGLGAEELIAELTTIIQGESKPSEQLAVRVLDELSAENKLAQYKNEIAVTKETSDLTPRQAQVLVMVAQGWTYREIGKKLFLSESTVKFHMREILDKLHLKKRSEVEAYVRKMGID